MNGVTGYTDENDEFDLKMWRSTLFFPIRGTMLNVPEEVSPIGRRIIGVDIVFIVVLYSILPNYCVDDYEIIGSLNNNFWWQRILQESAY